MRIADGEDNSIYVPVSEHLGKPSPYRKPIAIAAVAVADEAIYFSLLHPTKKNVGKFTSEVVFPNGPLSRLARKVQHNTSEDPHTMFVSFGEEEHQLTFTTDASGLAHITDDNNTMMEMPVRGILMDIHWYSPKVRRKVAVTFTGNFARPGTQDTLVRVVSMIVNSAAGLSDFRTVTGINRVDVPTKTTSDESTLRRSNTTHVQHRIPVWLYKEDGAALVQGDVLVTVDLLNANPSMPVLMNRYEPSANIEQVWHSYLTALDRAVTAHLIDTLSAEFVEQIVVDIVLGDVDARTVTEISNALVQLGGVKLTPSRYVNVAADELR